MFPVLITNVVLVGLQSSLQCHRQLLVDLMNSCLDFHLQAPLRCLYTILQNNSTHSDVQVV